MALYVTDAAIGTLAANLISFLYILGYYVTLFADETIRGGINFIFYRKKYGKFGVLAA